MGSKTLDAGEKQRIPQRPNFVHRRSLPFTKVEDEDLSPNGRRLTVSARNWSDTATFLVEAEVVHPMVSDMVRTSYPVTSARR